MGRQGGTNTPGRLAAGWLVAPQRPPSWACLGAEVRRGVGPLPVQIGACGVSPEVAPENAVGAPAMKGGRQGGGGVSGIGRGGEREGGAGSDRPLYLPPPPSTLLSLSHAWHYVKDGRLQQLAAGGVVPVQQATQQPLHKVLWQGGGGAAAGAGWGGDRSSEGELQRVHAGTRCMHSPPPNSNTPPPPTSHALARVLPRHNPDLALVGVGESPAAAAAVVCVTAAAAAGDAQQVEVVAVLRPGGKGGGTESRECEVWEGAWSVGKHL